MRTTGSAQPLLARGVYRAPFLSRKGVPVVIAVDRSGVVRDYVILRPGTSEARASAWLWTVLDRLDPLTPARPALRLVREGDAPDHRDPYAHPYRPPVESRRVAPRRAPMPPDDAIGHALRVAKQAARRVPYFRPEREDA